MMANHDCYPVNGRCHSHDKPLLFCENMHQVAILRAALGEVAPAPDVAAPASPAVAASSDPDSVRAYIQAGGVWPPRDAELAGRLGEVEGDNAKLERRWREHMDLCLEAEAATTRERHDLERHVERLLDRVRQAEGENARLRQTFVPFEAYRTLDEALTKEQRRCADLEAGVRQIAVDCDEVAGLAVIEDGERRTWRAVAAQARELLEKRP